MKHSFKSFDNEDEDSNDSVERYVSKADINPILDTRISVRPSLSRSGYLPWILKWTGLESSGKTKKISVFFGQKERRKKEEEKLFLR